MMSHPVMGGRRGRDVREQATPAPVRLTFGPWQREVWDAGAAWCMARDRHTRRKDAGITDPHVLPQTDAKAYRQRIASAFVFVRGGLLQALPDDSEARASVAGFLGALKAAETFITKWRGHHTIIRGPGRPVRPEDEAFWDRLRRIRETHQISPQDICDYLLPEKRRGKKAIPSPLTEDDLERLCRPRGGDVTKGVRKLRDRLRDKIRRETRPRPAKTPSG